MAPGSGACTLASMRVHPHPRLLLVPLALIGCVACGSSTDITRTDDDVEEWVAEQRAADKDRQARPSKLGHAPPAATAPGAAPAAAPTPCSADWYTQVEAKLHVLDAEGHGPDLGSAEWKGAVEHRLGVADDASFPELGTPAWCEAVDQRALRQ